MIQSLSTLESIFFAAREIASPAEQAAFLDQACAGNNDVRRSVERMLAAEPGLGSFLEAPAVAADATILQQSLMDDVGTQIGPYKLREVLGEGGMGIVYAAEQERPIRRKVALKLIKPGMDTREVIARFEAERQALALMDHPNIAKIIDGGTTGGFGIRDSGFRENDAGQSLNPESRILNPSAGRPYFVMELVRGLPLTTYCDQAKVPLRGRLKLFITVCQAIQHAHQKGIIHRDLKPSNVMVTLHDGVPVPKIIDFGVAKALNQRLTDHTVYTRVAQMLGTPMYMSPEQAELSGLDVDTRSDVYSLGVLLYELLTGQTPFDKDAFSKLGYDQILRMIREDEPPRPSARISTLAGESRSTIAGQRGLDDRHFARNLRGELDWIVMKALEKDRTRRYGSAAALGADLQRYLDDEPVEACPPSAAYRLRKFVRRNKVSLTIVALVLIGVTASATAISTALRERRGAPAGAAAVTGSVATRPVAVPAPPPRAPHKGRFLPGLVPEPTLLPGVGRWQLITKKPRGIIRCAMWNPDETLLALTEANHVRIYDAASLALQHVLVGHTQPVRSIDWHPDGKRLASCSEDGTVRLWTSTGIPTHLLSGHAGPVYQVAWRADGVQLASCGADGTVRLWSPEGKSMQILDEGGRHVFGIDWCPNGQSLATTGGEVRWVERGDGPQDNSLRIWNAESGKLINSIPVAGTQTGMCVAWHPDGRQLAVGFETGYELTPSPNVEIWNSDGQRGPQIYSGGGEVWAMAWHPDGSRLAFGGYGKTVWVWDTTSQGVRDLGIDDNSNLFWIAWSNHDNRLLTASRKSVLEWKWDSIDVSPLVVGISKRLGDGGQNGLGDVRWSPDGTLVAGRESYGSQHFWTADGTPQPAPERPAGQPPAWWEHESPDWRHDGTPAPALEGLSPREKPNVVEWAWNKAGWLAAASRSHDATIRIWNDAGQLVATCVGHRIAEQVSWSPDGQQLASMGGDSLRLWASDGTPGPVIAEHLPDAFGDISWSPNGRWIASGGDDAMVRLWRSDGSAGPVLLGHQGYVSSLAWSPDSRKLASGSSFDGTLRVWDVETGRTEWQVLRLDPDAMVIMDGAGEILHGDRAVLENELQYGVERSDGSLELMPLREFRKRYQAPLLQESERHVLRALKTHEIGAAAVEMTAMVTMWPDVDGNGRRHLSQMSNQLADAAYFDRNLSIAESAMRQAIALQEEVIAESPDDRAQQNVLSHQWMQLGRFLGATGRHSDAIVALSTAVEKSQSLLDAEPLGSTRSLSQSLYIRALHQLTLDAALADLNRVLEFDPQFDRLAWDLVYYLDDLVEEAPTSAANQAGNVPVEQHFEIAMAVYLEAVRRQPDLPSQHMLSSWLSSAPERFRDPELALELARRSVDLGPDNADIEPEESLAWAQFRMGDPQACLATLDGINGDLSASDMVRAMALHQLGNTSEARVAFDRATEWNKGYIEKAYMGRWKSGTIWHPTPGMIRRLQVEAAVLLGVTERKTNDAPEQPVSETEQ